MINMKNKILSILFGALLCASTASAMQNKKIKIDSLKTCSLTRFSDEMILIIMVHCDQKTLVEGLSLCCKRCRKLYQKLLEGKYKKFRYPVQLEIKNKETIDRINNINKFPKIETLTIFKGKINEKALNCIRTFLQRFNLTDINLQFFECPCYFPMFFTPEQPIKVKKITFFISALKHFGYAAFFPTAYVPRKCMRLRSIADENVLNSVTVHYKSNMEREGYDWIEFWFNVLPENLDSFTVYVDEKQVIKLEGEDLKKEIKKREDSSPYFTSDKYDTIKNLADHKTNDESYWNEEIDGYTSP
jgi:hypothetical protein